MLVILLNVLIVENPTEVKDKEEHVKVKEGENKTDKMDVNNIHSSFSVRCWN